MRNRYLATFEYNIFYYNDKDLGSVASKLCEILSDIGEHKASQISYKIDDNEIEISVKYKTFVIKNKTIVDNMEKFSLKLEL